MIICRNIPIDLRDVPKALYFLFNQPRVKETIKKIIGTANLIFAAWVIYDWVIKNRPPCSQQKTFLTRLIVLAAIMSIIGLALSTAPGSQIVGTITSSLFKEKRIVQWFGPHLNFATTPFHPRHIVSIVSVMLGIPALVHLIYTTIRPENDAARGKDRWIYLINAFNIITSRVALHAGNAFVRRNF